MLANCTFDVYTGYNPARPCCPPQGPARLAGQAGFLQHHVDNGRFGFVPAGAQRFYHTSVLRVGVGTDLRDGWDTETATFAEANADTVIVYDYPVPGVCTPFVVVLVQRVDRGGPGDYLRCYLDRGQPCYAPADQCPNPSDILVPCCPCLGLPTRLYGTWSSFPGAAQGFPGGFCPCVQGSWPLDYKSATGRWESPGGTIGTCSHSGTDIHFYCNSLSGQLSLDVTLDGTPRTGIVAGVGGCNPPPLNMAFTVLTFFAYLQWGCSNPGIYVPTLVFTVTP
jgi:hypothetical protein